MGESNFRQTEYSPNKMFIERRSSRALSGEPLNDEELFSILEAAKWAPSSYNAQPWRFIYIKNGSPAWDKLFSLVMDLNQIWMKRAAVMVLVLSRQNLKLDGQPNDMASFDTGAACENMALEATQRGLIAHPVGGFYKDRVKEAFQISDDYKVEVIIALGRPGDATLLPEGMQAKESPTDRLPLSSLISEDEFKFN